MSGLLTGMGPEGTALALLIVGHVLGDFAFQTEAMVEGKDRWGPLLAHGAVVTATQAIALTPMLTLRTGLLVLALGVTHVLVDGLKARIRDPEDPSLKLFAGDQLAHLLVLLVVWTQMTPAAWTASPVVQAVDGLPFQAWSMLSTGAIYVSAFVFARHGGNAIVRGVLPSPAPDPEQEQDLEAGATIGTLERVIVLVLGLSGQWEAAGLVVAAKAIARFEELKQRPFAEYFLVGTLASLLVAILLGLLVPVLV